MTALKSTIDTGSPDFRANEDAWAGRPFVDAIDVTLGNPPLRQILNLQVGRAEIIATIAARASIWSFTLSFSFLSSDSRRRSSELW